MTAPKEIKQRALELSSQGLSAEKVLKALDKEFNHSSDIPGERTIYRWRKEKPADSIQVPETPKPAVSTNLILANKKEHFDQLAEVAKALLIECDYLEDFIENPKKDEQQKEYMHPVGDEYWPVSRSQISLSLKNNLDAISGVIYGYEGWDISKIYPRIDIECLVSHLEEECSEVKLKGFAKAIEENPYEIIDTLRVLCRRKIFKGTCSICKDWTEISQLTTSEALLLERKKEHFDYLIGIANSLLDNVYLWGQDKENLAARLGQRYNFLLVEVYSPLDWESFESHLKEEYPALESKQLLDIIDEDPVGLVRALEIVVKRGTLKGRCSTCPE